MKYLLLDIKKPVRNIEHALNILSAVIQEAVCLNRTLVVGTFTISADGNLGYTLENTSFNHYVSLDKVQICRITDGDITQLDEPFNYTNAENFDLEAYRENELLLVKNNEIVSTELNHQYKVIVRKITTNKYSHSYSDILVHFPASAEVDRLSDVVLNGMGTNLKMAKQRAEIHYGVDYSANSDFYQTMTPRHPTHYACLYLRYDNTKTTLEKLYAMDIRQIQAIFNRARITKDRNVYVASDINDADYFEPLKKQCKLYQYHDFAELKALVSSKNGEKVDDAMLYSVEKNILQYAAIKMIPFEDLSGLPIIYGNSSHTTPWRYKFLACYKSLIRHTTRNDGNKRQISNI